MPAIRPHRPHAATCVHQAPVAPIDPMCGTADWWTPATGPGSPDPKQGAPEAAGARFLPTNEAPRTALPVPLLPLEVINLLAEIEPDNVVARTVTLRLRFIPKRSERQSRGD